MVELRPPKPPASLPAIPMRRPTPKIWLCSLLAVSLLVATSQYLAHFHVPRAEITAQGHGDMSVDHVAQEHCSLCLQFDRLPAPPATTAAPAAWFHLVATLEAERLERIALELPQLWPPSRGPPSLAC
jgi:hypothetical protein